MLRKKQKNFKVSNLTDFEFTELARRWNTSNTETLTIIVDRVYRAEFAVDGQLPTLSELAATVNEDRLEEP